MLVDGRLTTIVVKREAAEDAPNKPYALVYGIVEYVNNVVREGVYHARELPAVAMQVYHADYYLAQVNNGGHSQFIGNADNNLPTTSADALAGLKAMGADAQHRILSEMMAWVKANPQEAAAQNGFSVRAKLLDELDKRFYAAEKQTPMSECSAKWIAGWPNLRVAQDDDQYAAEIVRLAQLNPHLPSRKIWQNVQSLRYQMTDLLQLTVAAACGAVAPDPEIKLVVRAGSMMEVEGESCRAFGVGTDNGTRLCVIEDAGGRLYEFIVHKPATPEERKTFKPATVGARLSTVTAETIRKFKTIAEQTRAPEAIDLLLRKAALEPRSAITAWKLHDNGATWIAASGQRRVVATTSTDHATLRQHDGTTAASITRAEIEQHAAEAAAGRASMQPPA